MIHHLVRHILTWLLVGRWEIPDHVREAEKIAREEREKKYEGEEKKGNEKEDDDEDDDNDEEEEGVMYSFAILTTNSSSSLSWLHDRMPVLLEGDGAVERWLDVNGEKEEEVMEVVRDIRRPYSEPDISWYSFFLFQYIMIF